MSVNNNMNVLGNTRDEEGQLMLPGGRVGFLLMHGLGGTPVELRFVAQGLNRAGYTVLCPLMAGHGGSDLLLSTTRWKDWVASAESALERLRQSCDHVIIGGLSAGSIVALHVAAKRQEDVAGLVLYSPTFWPNGWAIPWYFHAFKLIKTKWFANLISLKERAPYGIKDDRIRRFVLESLQSGGRPLEDIFGRRGGTVFEFQQMTAAARKLLKGISKPAFVCHARQDDQSNLSNAMLLQHDLRGPVETLVLDDSYHMITLDRQRALVVDRTLAYAERLDLEAQTAKPVASQQQGAGTLNLVAKPGGQ
ncbi:MAG: alpha/beta fold hydrolase [Alphaproteobacteria bacterium]|nr:alpha/beta fold hydrolase [Alphaproteobacteria bacterium]